MPELSIADMYDRRIVALVALSIALTGATVLAAFAWLGFVTPNLLLGLCFAVGSGMALMGPAWQSSVTEQVPTETLPAAVALNGISYNIARSTAPRRSKFVRLCYKNLPFVSSGQADGRQSGRLVDRSLAHNR
jgi:MFS family permease